MLTHIYMQAENKFGNTSDCFKEMVMLYGATLLYFILVVVVFVHFTLLFVVNSKEREPAVGLMSEHLMRFSLLAIWTLAIKED